MASRKPPLAEVRAAVRSVHRGRHYVIHWVVDPEDSAIVDAFLNGPMGGHQIVLRFLTLEQGWTAPRCDPNVSPEEAVMDDELSTLRAQHAELLLAMSDESPPDAALA